MSCLPIMNTSNLFIYQELLDLYIIKGINTCQSIKGGQLEHPLLAAKLVDPLVVVKSIHY